MTGLRIAVVLATTAGGTGRHAAMLAAGCAERGMTVTVLGPPAARRFFPESRFLPLEIAAGPRPARDVAAVARLRRLLTACRPDVVHAHGLRAAAAASLALLPVPRGRPALLATVHNSAPPGAAPAAVYAALERLAAWRADAVLCVSPDLAARMRRAGARDVTLAVVAAPAGPLPSDSAVARARADLGAPGRQVVLAAGRLAPQKGLDVLIDAVALLWGRKPPALLVIAGEGPLEVRLGARASDVGAEVRFLGPRQDVPALLAAADVVVVPSRWEGQPLIVQEALRSGRPVVASRAGGIPCLTGKDGALLVPPSDAGALAAAIASVLDDPELARGLAAAAAARARELPSPSDAVDAVAAVYARLAAAAAGPRPRPRRV